VSSRLLRWFIAAVSLLAQGFAYYQLHFAAAGLPLPPRWEGQFGVLLMVSAVLTLALPFLDKPYLSRIVLTFRVLLVFFAAMPLGEFFWPRLTMVSVLCIEVIEYGGLFYGSVCAVFLLLGADLISGIPLKAWGVRLPIPPLHARIAFYAYNLPIIFLATIITYQNKKQVPEVEFSSRLYLATIELAEANMKLQDYAALAEQGATASERKRMAREIHDTLAYTLTNLIIMLEAAMVMAGSQNAALVEYLGRARDQARNGLSDVRRALQALRPIELAETTGLSAVGRLVQAFAAATGIDITLSMGDAPFSLGEEADHVVYRLVQEGITNALRHGRATEIIVSFYRKDGGLGVGIKDNGIGTSGVKEGFGLLGIRERIEQLGGELTIYGEPRQGFILSAWFAMPEVELA